VDVDHFLQSIRCYRTVTEITSRMVGELIDHIDVYQAEKSEGIHTQRIVIYYNCIGQFSVPNAKNIPYINIVMETKKGGAVSYSPERSV